MKASSLLPFGLLAGAGYALYRFWPSISSMLPGVAVGGGSIPPGAAPAGGAPSSSPPVVGAPPAGTITPGAVDPEAAMKRAATDVAAAAGFPGRFNVDQWLYYYVAAGRPRPAVVCYPSPASATMGAQEWHQWLLLTSQRGCPVNTEPLPVLSPPVVLPPAAPPAGPNVSPGVRLVTEDDFSNAATSMAAAAAADQSQRLNVDQWNYYYSRRSGAALPVVSFPGGDRGALLSPLQWRAFAAPLIGQVQAGLTGVFDPVFGFLPNGGLVR